MLHALPIPFSLLRRCWSLVCIHFKEYLSTACPTYCTPTRTALCCQMSQYLTFLTYVTTASFILSSSFGKLSCSPIPTKAPLDTLLSQFGITESRSSVSIVSDQDVGWMSGVSCFDTWHRHKIKLFSKGPHPASDSVGTRVLSRG